VSERHLRRALEREFGVSPLELAQTHRLLLAKRLLADTNLPVTRIAFASGFQSVRSFNSTFRDQYRLTPTALRRTRRNATTEAPGDRLRLTLAYRRPFDWTALLDHLKCAAITGVEAVDQNRYGRTVEMDGKRGVVFISDSPHVDERHAFLNVEVSTALVPVLMPLLVRIRQLFDLDAEPQVIDTHLRAEGLGPLIDRHPGLRVPGALDGFEVLLRSLLTEGMPASTAPCVFMALGPAIDTGDARLHHLTPDAARVADAGASGSCNSVCHWPARRWSRVLPMRCWMARFASSLARPET
jgi:AraC family transcriptional regulator of adaptative response / DNA-3-methyladenine glycosylase II